MSATAVDETSSEEVLSPRSWPFRPEAPQSSNSTGHESLKDYINEQIFNKTTIGQHTSTILL